jgi:hypothetical protein
MSFRNWGRGTLALLPILALPIYGSQIAFVSATTTYTYQIPPIPSHGMESPSR